MSTVEELFTAEHMNIERYVVNPHIELVVHSPHNEHLVFETFGAPEQGSANQTPGFQLLFPTNMSPFQAFDLATKVSPPEQEDDAEITPETGPTYDLPTSQLTRGDRLRDHTNYPAQVVAQAGSLVIAYSKMVVNQEDRVTIEQPALVNISGEHFDRQTKKLVRALVQPALRPALPTFYSNAVEAMQLLDEAQKRAA